MNIEDLIFPVISLGITIVTVIVGYVRKIAKLEQHIALIEQKCKTCEGVNIKDKLGEMSDRLKALEIKTELFWNAIEKEVIDILHHPGEVRRDELLEKLRDKTITLREMEELKCILEGIVKERSSKDEIIGAVLLIGRLDQLLYDGGRFLYGKGEIHV